MEKRTTPLLSSRSVNTPASPIRSLSPYAREAIQKGTHVHFLNIGQPDMPAPDEFLKSLRNYPNDIISYEISEGSPVLREEWSKFLKKSSNIEVTPDEVIITTGASEALVFTFMVCCDPGSEVIVIEPTYANYMGFAATSGVQLVPVLTLMQDNFALTDEDLLIKKINANTRAILLCNPNNPSGTVYSEAELRQFLEICETHNLFLIVDETYRKLVFDNIPNPSILEIAKDNPRVIMIDSLSKRFSLCGARIGGIFSYNKDFLEKVLKLAQARLASPSIAQYACSQMLSSISTEYVEQVSDEYEKRRNALVSALDQIPDIEYVRPAGAFYCLAELPVKDSKDFVKFMLQDFSYHNETVFVAPAAGFYLTAKFGRSKVRIASVLEADKLRRAIELLAYGLQSFRQS